MMGRHLLAYTGREGAGPTLTSRGSPPTSRRTYGPSLSGGESRESFALRLPLPNPPLSDIWITIQLLM
ncbi:hypothetical protein FACS1894124_1510 [Spirochaetia bacterium]|nr:hypothetical protein FACS1894124_1510 [Spirochaetia bacterium]